MNIYNKIIILIIVFLIPIDFFSPGTLFFKEAGAKPLNIFIIFYIVISIILGGKYYLKENKFLSKVNKHLFLILCFGIIAFFINYFTFTYPKSNRDPEIQFIFQSSMFLMFILVFNGLVIFFSKIGYREYALKVIPIAVGLHLIIFILEFSGFYNFNNPGILSFFRSSASLIDRPSGLMSEPSYFGTFAGIYALPLLCLGKKYKVLYFLFSLSLIVLSIQIEAKTFFIVILLQILFLFIGEEKSKKTKILIGCFSFLLAISGLYMMIATSVFDVDANLSSAMRLGSNLLALNVATSGYGLVGVGFGQFHFFYTPEYSPKFLLLSKEALDQMNNVSDGRASTYSLPLRLLVETGILGIVMGFVLMRSIFRKFCKSKDSVTKVGLLFISGSIGFLLTQDSYCLPSLAFGLALVVTQPEKQE